MYYILGFVGKHIDEVKIRNIILSLHKNDYKTPNLNKKINITFLSENLLDDTLSTQLKYLNTTMMLNYDNKEKIIEDIFANKLRQYTNENLNEITYIIINNITYKKIIKLIRSYTFHKLYFFSNNKKPVTNTDFYTYKFINKIIRVFYGYNYLEHMFDVNDEWIISANKGHYDVTIHNTLKSIHDTILENIKLYNKINMLTGK